MLAHDLTEIHNIDGVRFRTCSPSRDGQATALGGTLLLPRSLLLAAANRGLVPDRIAASYAVTTDLARYRYKTTGVAKQLERRASADAQRRYPPRLALSPGRSGTAGGG